MHSWVCTWMGPLRLNLVCANFVLITSPARGTTARNHAEYNCWCSEANNCSYQIELCIVLCFFLSLELCCSYRRQIIIFSLIISQLLFYFFCRLLLLFQNPFFLRKFTLENLHLGLQITSISRIYLLLKRCYLSFQFVALFWPDGFLIFKLLPQLKYFCVQFGHLLVLA